MEKRQEAQEAELSQADSPPSLLHPNMAQVYHRKIRELHTTLTGDDSKTEAAEILRTLIDAIVLTPEDSELSIYLKGDLAGILTLAQSKRKPLARVAKGSGIFAQQVLWVAGGMQHPLCSFCDSWLAARRCQISFSLRECVSVWCVSDAAGKVFSRSGQRPRQPDVWSVPSIAAVYMRIREGTRCRKVPWDAGGSCRFQLMALTPLTCAHVCLEVKDMVR